MGKVPTVFVETNAEQLDALKSAFAEQEKLIPKAIAWSINKTLATVRSRVVDLAVEEIGTRKRAPVAAAVRVERATQGTLAGAVMTSSRRIPIREARGLWQDTARGGGVHFIAGKGGQFRFLRHAFITTLDPMAAMSARFRGQPLDKANVYTRTGRDRFPVQVKYLRSPTTALQLFIDEVLAEGDQLLAHYVAQTVDYFVEKFGVEGAEGELERLWSLAEQPEEAEAANG